jgi:uncharacterized membrane protein
MHLIPASWSHLHMLVSVFPSVGLIFAIGFLVTSMVTKNEAMQRICLTALGILGLLAIPTYVSGSGSMATLSEKPDISADLMSIHYFWSWSALVLIGITGLVAWLTLWRSRGAGRPSNNALHLVLGLSIVTLLTMILVGEQGWEIAHHELGLATPKAGTPQGWSHIHIILNHFPTVGFVFGLAFYVCALILKNDVMKRSALVVFVMCAILGATTYVTGASAMWALTQPPFKGISQAVINAHRDWALMSLFGLAFTGLTSYLELWRFRYLGRFSKLSLNLILGFAIVTLGVLAETGHRGGQINHPEIRLPTDILPTDPNAYWSPAIENLINNVIWFVPWQTVHFFGYTLVFSTVLAVTLRIFGFWKSMPFSAIHRLLPLGAFGVAMNIFTGMLMLMADTYRYINEIAFWPKMFFLPIAAISILYFSLSEKLWNVKAGEDAPMSAKWVASLVLVSWTIVIMGGRLLPYLDF